MLVSSVARSLSTTDSRQVSGVTSVKREMSSSIAQRIREYNAAVSKGRPLSDRASPQTNAVSQYAKAYNASAPRTSNVAIVPLKPIDPFKVVAFSEAAHVGQDSELLSQLNEAVSSTETVRELMDKGATPTANTLDIALRSKASLETLRLLLTKVKPTDTTLATAFNSQSPVETVGLLIETSDLLTTATLHNALRCKASQEVIVLLLGKGIKPKNYPPAESTLPIALNEIVPAETIRVLIEAGAEVKDDHLHQAMHPISTRRYYSSYTKQDAIESLETIKLLLEKRARPINDGVLTSLYYASFGASREIIQLLIDAGARNQWNTTNGAFAFATSIDSTHFSEG